MPLGKNLADCANRSNCIWASRHRRCIAAGFALTRAPGSQLSYRMAALQTSHAALPRHTRSDYRPCSAVDLNAVIHHLEVIPDDSPPYAQAADLLSLLRIQRDRPRDSEIAERAKYIAPQRNSWQEARSRLERPLGSEQNTQLAHSCCQTGRRSWLVARVVIFTISEYSGFDTALLHALEQLNGVQVGISRCEAKQ